MPILNLQPATQTILSLPSFEVFLLSLDPSLSVCWQKMRHLSFVLLFIISLTICRRVLSCDVRGLHVDLGTVTSIRWACGLVAASRLLFYLYNRITSTKQKKKRPSQQLLGQAALFSHLGKSWGFGSWVSECSLPACAHTLCHSETLSRGISCWSPRNEELGVHLIGFAWLYCPNFCFGKHFGGSKDKCTDCKAPWGRICDMWYVILGYIKKRRYFQWQFMWLINKFNIIMDILTVPLWLHD